MRRTLCIARARVHCKKWMKKMLFFSFRIRSFDGIIFQSCCVFTLYLSRLLAGGLYINCAAQTLNFIVYTHMYKVYTSTTPTAVTAEHRHSARPTQVYARISQKRPCRRSSSMDSFIAIICILTNFIFGSRVVKTSRATTPATVASTSSHQQQQHTAKWWTNEIANSAIVYCKILLCNVKRISNIFISVLCRHTHIHTSTRSHSVFRNMCVRVHLYD